MPGRLEGKVAVVTGAGSGIGRSIAVLFAKEGAKVVAADLDAKGLEETLHLIRGQNGAATAVQANVSKEEDVARMIGTAADTYGALDVLVNNAGVMDDMEPVDATTNQQWERVLGVNLNGVFFASRLAAQHMLKKGQGAIVNIASVGGLFGGRAGAAYTASKHAVVGLTRNMAYMYADKGIRANAIAPGAVATNIARSMRKPHPDGARRMQLGFATSPRPADPDTIARLALFLASSEAGNVNGAVVTADGGWTAY